MQRSSSKLKQATHLESRLSQSSSPGVMLHLSQQLHLVAHLKQKNSLVSLAISQGRTCYVIQTTACLAALAFFKIVGPTALALLLCNMDRICMSVAILPMAKEFGWPASVQVQPSKPPYRGLYARTLNSCQSSRLPPSCINPAPSPNCHVPLPCLTISSHHIAVSYMYAPQHAHPQLCARCSCSHQLDSSHSVPGSRTCHTKGCRMCLQGLVQSGFLWGYMATQMIGGSLADKYGGETKWHPINSAAAHKACLKRVPLGQLLRRNWALMLFPQ